MLLNSGYSVAEFEQMFHDTLFSTKCCQIAVP